jgi:hypothetical protein
VRLTGAQAASLRPLPQGAPTEAHVGLAGRRCLDGRQKAAPVMPKSRAAAAVIGLASLARPGAANGCTYLMMKSCVLMGPRLTLEGAASYK